MGNPTLIGSWYLRFPSSSRIRFVIFGRSERIAFECGGDDGRKCIRPFASIDGLDGDEDASAVAKCQYDVTATMNCVKSDSSVSMGDTMLRSIWN